jgi:chromosome segregation ATPase
LIEQSAKTTAEEHAVELARLNVSIEAERNRYQQQAEQMRAELATVKAKAEAADQAHQEQRKTAAQEAHRVAERMTKAEADRDTARKEASSAREDAAKLRGQVEAMQAQANDLMRALAARQSVEGEIEAESAPKGGAKAKKAE